MNIVIVIIGSLAIAALRFTVPGHDLSYPGTYEAFAHIWIGVLLTLSLQRNWIALGSGVIISVLELVCFIMR